MGGFDDLSYDLLQSNSKQSDLFVALLPQTDYYTLSCADLLLPNLEIDDEFTLAQPSSLIMDNLVVLPTEATLDMVRRKVHVSRSRVIIDDVIIYSISLSLCLLLLKFYMRIYFNYRESFNSVKCDFLSNRFKFVGRDTMPDDNITASS